MSSHSLERAELLEAIGEALRRSSTWTVIFHQALAMQLGLNPTDLKSADLLYEMGAMTAGELADLTGLTTGAITGVIDRLEKAGLVCRDKDPNDRRRVIIRLTNDPERIKWVLRLFGSLNQATDQGLSRYTDEELATILDFLNWSHQVMRTETDKLRTAAAPVMDTKGNGNGAN
jgi:DNA-binding MarR family transcriptional regulator